MPGLDTLFVFGLVRKSTHFRAFLLPWIANEVDLARIKSFGLITTSSPFLHRFSLQLEDPTPECNYPI